LIAAVIVEKWMQRFRAKADWQYQARPKPKTAAEKRGVS